MTGCPWKFESAEYSRAKWPYRQEDAFSRFCGRRTIARIFFKLLSMGSIDTMDCQLPIVTVRHGCRLGVVC